MLYIDIVDVVCTGLCVCLACLCGCVLVCLRAYDALRRLVDVECIALGLCVRVRVVCCVLCACKYVGALLWIFVV